MCCPSDMKPHYVYLGQQSLLSDKRSTHIDIYVLAITYAQVRRKYGWWLIHHGFKTHGQSRQKSKTESTSGSTNGDSSPQI